MLCAIGYIFASIFRGNGLGDLATLIIAECDKRYEGEVFLVVWFVEGLK